MFTFLKKKGVSPRERLEEMMGEFSLPSFPAIVTDILATLRDPGAAGSSITDKLSLDPALSIEVLRLTNSAAFAPRKTIEDLNQAVMMLGRSKLETVILPYAMRDVTPAVTDSLLDMRNFWRTAARRAATAQHLARSWHPGRDGECFLAGYLQDLAIPFLLQAQPDDYSELLAASHDANPAWLHEQEQQRFGWDHGEVATWMLNEWGLSENLAIAIGGHHSAQKDSDCPDAVLVTALIAGHEEEQDRARLIEHITARNGDPEQAAVLVDECMTLGNDLAQAIG